MIRNLKVLGLALVAVFAFGAVAASAASAHLFHSSSSTEKTVFTGTTEEGTTEQFRTNGQTEGEPVSECHLSYVGTGEPNTLESVTVKPTDQANCTTFGAGDTHVRFNHCAYVFHGETNAENLAAIDIECAAENEIEIDITSICTIKIPAQNGLIGVHYNNISSTEVTVEAAVMGIEYTKKNQTGNQFFCGLVEGNGADGTYIAKDIIKGYEYSGTIPANGSTERTTPGELTEGSQVNISVE